MPDFAYSTEAVINAAPQAIFDIVSDPSRHVELAGSGELNTVTQAPTGPVGIGTHIAAEETVKFADGGCLEVIADSVVVTYNPPSAFSWIVNPMLADQMRRVQWWFHLSPQSSGTKVVHEMEVDFGELHDPVLIGLRDNFEQVRAGVVRAGMVKTLENLKRMVEQ